MGRKVFISFLGGGYYKKCKYYKDDYVSSDTLFIQEATLNYLTTNEDWSDTDKAYILLTEGARNSNWVDNGIVLGKEGVFKNQTGLANTLKKNHYPFKVQDVSIPDGNNEQELWQIFNTVYSLIENEDELYFDITHGFRYLPMFILVFTNYAHFLKHTIVRSITYGNFEAVPNETAKPLMSLLPLNLLQEWSIAASNYLENGSVKKLIEISNSKILPLAKESKGKSQDLIQLKSFIANLERHISHLQNCRGIDITEAKTIDKLKSFDVENTIGLIEPLTPIINKIKSSIENYDDKHRILNGCEAARWCYEKSMYQQSVTFLQESIVSFLCYCNELDWKTEQGGRFIISEAFKYDNNRNSWKCPYWTKDEQKLKILLDIIVQSEPYNNLKESYMAISGIRNDMNHAGYNGSPRSAERLRETLKRKLDDVKAVIDKYCPDQNTTSEKEGLFLNISNHPSEKWSPEQVNEAQKHGKIIDILFPVINPKSTTEDIAQIADDYAQKVLELSKGKTVSAHVMGEMTLTLAIVRRLQDYGIKCYASTTERIVNDGPNGQKISIFKFVAFRKYE